MAAYDFRIVLGILGDADSGKTKLFDNLQANLVPEAPTSRGALGCTAYLCCNDKGRTVMLTLRDYSEQAFREIRRGNQETIASVFECDGFLVLCNPKQQRCLENLNTWFDLIKAHAHPSAAVWSMIVASHAEEKNLATPLEKVQAWASERGCVFGRHERRMPPAFQGSLLQLFSKIVSLDNFPILRRGYCAKQGSFFKTWRRRFFVLEDTGKLRYYDKTVSARSLKGEIDLKTATAVLDGDACNVIWPAGADMTTVFGIVTPKRTYFLITEDTVACTGWKRDILKIIQGN